MDRPLYQRAINPGQYDLPDVKWDSEIGLTAPTRKFLYDQLLRYQHRWKNADVLDIGCGTGWLLNLIQQNGGKSVVGFDPGAGNVATAKKHFSGLNIQQADLEHFSTDQQYDLIFATMVFVHIADVTAAFKKITSWMKPSGELQMIVPDFEYFKKSRPLQDAKYEEVSPDEYVGQITREQGIISDIIRTNSYYQHAAEAAGLIMVEEIPLKPTEDLMASRPRYALFKDAVIAQLMRFTLQRPVPTTSRV